MRRKIASPVTERSASAPLRWQAVCLKPGHNSFASRPFSTVTAAAKFMARSHPGCAFEFIAVNDRVDRSAALALVSSRGLSSDELVGD